MNGPMTTRRCLDCKWQHPLNLATCPSCGGSSWSEPIHAHGPATDETKCGACARGVPARAIACVWCGAHQPIVENGNTLAVPTPPQSEVPGRARCRDVGCPETFDVASVSCPRCGASRKAPAVKSIVETPKDPQPSPKRRAA